MNICLQLLAARPTCFYYSPLKLFIISVVFYTIYLFTFAYHLSCFIYLWSDITMTEYILWVFNLGYILYEITEIIFKISLYFKDLWNY